MPITIEITPEAQRMLDEADERWIEEHGLFADNPSFDQMEDAARLLCTTPRSASCIARLAFGA